MSARRETAADRNQPSSLHPWFRLFFEHTPSERQAQLEVACYEFEARESLASERSTEFVHLNPLKNTCKVVKTCEVES